MRSELKVFSDLSEELNYNLSDFPLYVRKGKLKYFDRYEAACHWHYDLEFILVLEGSMDYFVNGQTVQIANGNGIFINSKRLHYGFSYNKSDCSFIVVAIHPNLLGINTYTCKTYIEEKFSSITDDFIVLTTQYSWQKEILDLIKEIYEEMNKYTKNPIRLISQASSICAYIADNIQQSYNNIADDKSMITIWKMTEYIHENYSLKIGIDDIAAAGIICRSRCCELFNKYIGQTPNTYLTRYRVHKSCDMLRETNRSVSEIAIECGFQTSSYFSYVFRKEIGMTPQNYRKNIKTSINYK